MSPEIRTAVNALFAKKDLAGLNRLWDGLAAAEADTRTLEYVFAAADVLRGNGIWLRNTNPRYALPQDADYDPALAEVVRVVPVPSGLATEWWAQTWPGY